MKIFRGRIHARHGPPLGGVTAVAVLAVLFAALPALAQTGAELRVRAEQGDAPAQFMLGRMYANGDGVPQDAAEAVRWYRLAAEQGLAEAQFNLGVMYANGQGVSHKMTSWRTCGSTWPPPNPRVRSASSAR